MGMGDSFLWQEAQAGHGAVAFVCDAFVVILCMWMRGGKKKVRILFGI
jgi:hypothetical protein